MAYYTNEQRRRGAATRRRNARLRRKEIAKLGYNPYNPTVNLAENVVVTQAVQKRLTKKAKSGTPVTLVGIWVLTGFLISRFPISEWSLLGLLPAAILTVLLIFPPRSHIIELAKERKKRLDEMKQFYSSPEWHLIREQVIREEGEICFQCGKYIWNKIDVTVDHKLPRSKYPNLALDRQNLRVLCRSCNSSKGDRDSEIFAVEAPTKKSPIEESEIQESFPVIREKTQSDVNELAIKTIVPRRDQPATKRDWTLFVIAVLVIVLGVWAVAVFGK